MKRSAYAGKGHEECSKCHSVHEAKDILLFRRPIDSDILNPHTDGIIEKIDALCLSCHVKPPTGEGIREIDPERKHPFGIEPTLVLLPEDVKGFGGINERLTCVGCHAPHPSNQNIFYLRTPEDLHITKQEDIMDFCLWCHPGMEEWLAIIPKQRAESHTLKRKLDDKGSVKKIKGEDIQLKKKSEEKATLIKKGLDEKGILLKKRKEGESRQKKPDRKDSYTPLRLEPVPGF